MYCTHIYYNYLLITDIIVKILALSIVSLQLPLAKLLVQILKSVSIYYKVHSDWYEFCHIKLCYKGKTIIVKNLLLSYCGFEIEMKGIPDKFKKEIETLIWNFIWEGKDNQIKRDLCSLDIENGGMSMVNLESYIDSRRIKCIYRIINEPIENWNAIGKYWLSRLDFKFNETFFVFKCSNVSSLNLKCFIKNQSNHGQNLYNVYKRWKPKQISCMLDYLGIVI